MAADGVCDLLFQRLMAHPMRTYIDGFGCAELMIRWRRNPDAFENSADVPYEAERVRPAENSAGYRRAQTAGWNRLRNESHRVREWPLDRSPD